MGERRLDGFARYTPGPQRPLYGQRTDAIRKGLDINMRQDPNGDAPSPMAWLPAIDTYPSDTIALTSIRASSGEGIGTDILADATRLIRSGSFYLNDRKVNDPRHELHRQDLVEGRVAMIKMGTRNHLVLSIQEDGA